MGEQARTNKIATCQERSLARNGRIFQRDRRLITYTHDGFGAFGAARGGETFAGFNYSMGI